MKSLIKFPLLVLLVLVAEVTLPGRAIAGRAPVALPESGSSSSGDTFSPGSEQAAVLSERIGGAVNNTVQTIQSSQEVPSVGNRTLSISSEKLNVIIAAISNTGSDIKILEEQISEEMGVEIELSVLGTSSRELNEAIASVNALIRDLNGEQLAAAVESPTFMALLKMLGNANQAVTDGSDDLIVPGSPMGIVKISLR